MQKTSAVKYSLLFTHKILKLSVFKTHVCNPLMCWVPALFSWYRKTFSEYLLVSGKGYFGVTLWTFILRLDLVLNHFFLYTFVHGSFVKTDLTNKLFEDLLIASFLDKIIFHLLMLFCFRVGVFFLSKHVLILDDWSKLLCMSRSHKNSGKFAAYIRN